MDIKKLDQIMVSLIEVKAEKDLWQNDFHEFDVYEHTMSFVKHIKELIDDPNLIAAGYLHDIGKPVVATPKYKDGILQEREPGKPYNNFDDHENVGAEMVKNMDPNIFIELNLIQNKVARLVEFHYVPMKKIKDMRKCTTFEDFSKKFHELEAELNNSEVTKSEIMTMFLADKLAQGKFCTDKDELFTIREAILEKDVSLRDIFELQQKKYH